MSHPKPWKYLEHPAFFARQATAAWFLREVDQVLELGSYKTPLSQVLRLGQDYIGIDPLADENFDGTVVRSGMIIKGHFPSLFFFPDPLRTYGLAILGMDLELDSSGREELYHLIDGSRITVIEFPPAHAPSLRQFEDILAKVQKKVTYQVKFDFSGNSFELEGSAPLMPIRQLYILEDK